MRIEVKFITLEQTGGIIKKNLMGDRKGEKLCKSKYVKQVN